MTTHGTYRPRHAAPTVAIDRRMIVVLAALLAIVVSAALLWWRSANPATRVSEAPTPADAEGDRWATQLADLYEIRANAFDAGDALLLRDVYTLDSRQLRTDTEIIESLQAQDRDIIGFAPRLLDVQVESVGDTETTLHVRDEIAEFTILDSTGTEMPVAGRAATDVTVTLRLESGRWLIAGAVRGVG